MTPHVVINVHLLPWAQNNFQWRLCSHHVRKANLPEIRDNNKKARKVHADQNKFFPGKEWRLYAQ